MKFRRSIIDFTVITSIFFVGYVLSFYGGHMSEVNGKSNVYMMIGIALMWPWILLDLIQGWVFPERKSLEIYSSVGFYYLAYYLAYYFVCYFYRKIRSWNKAE